MVFSNKGTVKIEGTTAEILTDIHEATLALMKIYKDDLGFEDDSIKELIDEMVSNVFDEYDGKESCEGNYEDEIAKEIEQLSKSVKEILESMEKAVENIKRKN